MRGIDRQAILRGVYEDNLRVARKENRKNDQVERGRPLWSPRLLAFTGVVFLIFGSVVFQDLSANQHEHTAVVQGLLSELPSTDFTLASSREPVEETSVAPRPIEDMSIADLYNLRVKTIVIDPGHGGRDPGAVGHLGTYEKDITLDIALRLRDRLRDRHGFSVLMTRDEDVRVTNKERVAFANSHETDLFISIHVNWLPEEPVTSIETYYFGQQTDKRTLQLAERENRDSDFSVAEFRRMVQELNTTMKLEESKRLARSIQESLYRNLREINPNVTDWGVKSAPFIVLLGVEAPSVLAEIACISNKEEEARLNADGFREKLTGFLEEGIVRYLNQSLEDEKAIAGATENATKEKE